MKTLLYKIYGIYAALLFIILAFTMVAPVLLFWPNMRQRLRWAYLWARLYFFLVGIRLDIQGLNNLPKETSIITLNHVSNIDGPLIKAILPSRYSFVAKRELAEIPIISRGLRNIGTVFVERADPSRGRKDSNFIIQTMRNKKSLIIFPEGGFSYSAGIKPFKKGGFIAAVRTKSPVVPGVIIGAREICPPDSIWLKPGLLTIKFFPAIHPCNDDGNAVDRLLTEVRSVMVNAQPECQPVNAYDEPNPPLK